MADYRRTFFYNPDIVTQFVSEFNEFEPRLKFKPQLKYGWFYLKLYLIFQDLSRRSIETGFRQI